MLIEEIARTKIKYAKSDSTIYSRDVDILPKTLNKEKRTVEAIFTTSLAVNRGHYHEQLDLAPQNVDLSRINDGQVKLLDSHNYRTLDDVLGSVDAAWIEGEKLVGRISFHKTERAQKAMDRVERGETTGISIGYQVNKWEFQELPDDEILAIARNWELLEVSLVSVPADKYSTIRSIQSKKTRNRIMSEQVLDNTSKEKEVQQPANIDEKAKEIEAEARSKIDQNNKRVEDILDLATRHDAMEIGRKAIAEGTSLEDFGLQILNQKATKSAETSINPANIQVGISYDDPHVQRNLIADALAARITKSKPVDKASEKYRSFTFHSVVELLTGKRLTSDNRVGIIEDLLRGRSHSSSDFPYILESISQKTLLARYEMQTPTFQEVAKERDFTDFKEHSFVKAGEFPVPQLLAETAEVKYGKINEEREKVALATYGGGLQISAQIIINDDLGAFNDLITPIADTDLTMQESVFYNLLNQNSGAGPTLNDQIAMFHADHNNKAANSKDITLTNLAAARAKMMRQSGLGTGKDKTYIQVMPDRILVSPDKFDLAEQFYTNVNAPDSSTNKNNFHGRLRPISSPYVEGNRWYLFGNPAIHSNFIYGYLRGNRAPIISLEYKNGIYGYELTYISNFAVGAIDYRAGYFSANGS